MANITCFDDLSPELILCIFDYLPAADRFKGFFDCNSRLRTLVKKHTEFSRQELDADILRFSTLHSWYKHLSFENGGTLKYIVPMQGQQMRYSFDPCVTDTDGLHWHFIDHGYETNISNEQVRDIITRYPIRLNPFFYHAESKGRDKSNVRSFCNGDIIMFRYRSVIEKWLHNNYAEYAEEILKLSNFYDYTNRNKLVPVFDGEWLKATTSIKIAATQIWNELKEFDDINPLQITFK